MFRSASKKTQKTGYVIRRAQNIFVALKETTMLFKIFLFMQATAIVYGNCPPNLGCTACTATTYVASSYSQVECEMNGGTFRDGDCLSNCEYVECNDVTPSTFVCTASGSDSCAGIGRGWYAPVSPCPDPDPVVSTAD